MSFLKESEEKYFRYTDKRFFEDKQSHYFGTSDAPHYTGQMQYFKPIEKSYFERSKEHYAASNPKGVETFQYAQKPRNIENYDTWSGPKNDHPKSEQGFDRYQKKDFNSGFERKHTKKDAETYSQHISSLEHSDIETGPKSSNPLLKDLFSTVLEQTEEASKYWNDGKCIVAFHVTSHFIILTKNTFVIWCLTKRKLT